MSRDEAAAIGWPFLELVPDPPPEARAAHLRVAILNASDTFGPDHTIVSDLKAKFDAAMRQVVKEKPRRD